MSDDSGAENEAIEGAESPTDVAETAPKRLSDDGVILALAGAACLLAATTAHVRGQPEQVTFFALMAGIPAVGAVLLDFATDYVPGVRVHLLLGVAAVLGATFAVPDRHYVNIATLLVAGLMGLGRVYEREYRDKGPES